MNRTGKINKPAHFSCFYSFFKHCAGAARQHNIAIYQHIYYMSAHCTVCTHFTSPVPVMAAFHNHLTQPGPSPLLYNLKIT